MMFERWRTSPGTIRDEYGEYVGQWHNGKAHGRGIYRLQISLAYCRD
jgi:hypothetical protein